MSTEYKSVRLESSVYEILERRKRSDESFSDVVERLARERPISDLAGVFSDEDVAEIRRVRERGYGQYADSRRDEMGGRENRSE